MRQTIIANGMRYDLDATDELILVVKDGRAGRSLTYTADTPYGVNMIEAGGSMEQTHITLSFTIQNIKIEETE